MVTGISKYVDYLLAVQHRQIDRFSRAQIQFLQNRLRQTEQRPWMRVHVRKFEHSGGQNILLALRQLVQVSKRLQCKNNSLYCAAATTSETIKFRHGQRSLGFSQCVQNGHPFLNRCDVKGVGCVVNVCDDVESLQANGARSFAPLSLPSGNRW